MTKDEACAILAGCQHIHREDANVVEALQMAIEALNDGKEVKTISKDALIDQYITSDLWNAPYKGDEE